MGFLKKAGHNIPKDESTVKDAEINEAKEVTDDDFDTPVTPPAITREEFHNIAEENLADVISETNNEINDTAEVANEVKETIENDNAETPQEEYEVFDAGDDFEFDSDDEEPQKEDASVSDEIKLKKEKKPRMTFGEFCAMHRQVVKITLICLGVFLAACIGLYIYGCATVPVGVMGRNIYIEDIDVSNLTYEEALRKVKAAKLLDDCDLTLVSSGKTYVINGIDIGLTAKIEDTVGKTMRYGKTGNIFIDGLANALQVVKRHTVLPSADVNEEILRQKLVEFGNQVHGELVEHKLEIGDQKLICTPGHTGFSGNVDRAYNQVIEAIKDENFSRIRVTLKSAPPKSLTVEDIDAFTYTNPQDAHFEVKDNEVITVPEVWGRHLDLKAIEPLVSKIKEGGEVITIPFYTTAPNITADELGQKLFNTTLASYSTSYGGSSSNRAGNIANAASRINNKVLAPGEVFSFNDTVGKRSAANGFFPAPEYANGQTVIGIGGGTCQVSSTLYNAVLYADLSIVSRLNHMFAVGYCPLGQDATVSDSGVDFKFANNTDYPIKIVATASGGSIKVSILGTERDVKHTVKIQNNVSYSGGNRNVRSYRYVYDPNGTLIRQDDLGNSYYMSHQETSTSNTSSAPASSGPATTAPAPAATSAPAAAPAATVAPVPPAVPAAPATGEIESTP